jgi:hypothetical protein
MGHCRAQHRSRVYPIIQERAGFDDVTVGYLGD